VILISQKLLERTLVCCDATGLPLVNSPLKSMACIETQNCSWRRFGQTQVETLFSHNVPRDWRRRKKMSSWFSPNEVFFCGHVATFIQTLNAKVHDWTPCSRRTPQHYANAGFFKPAPYCWFNSQQLTLYLLLRAFHSNVSIKLTFIVCQQRAL